MLDTADGSSNSIQISQTAYLLPVLHSLKYPANSVNGVLLGTAEKHEDGKVVVKVTESVPLLHTFLALSPAMDAGCALVDEYCKKQNLAIVGYYHANSHQAHNQMTPLSKRFADKVIDGVRESGKKWVPGVCMLVDNQSLDDLADALVDGVAMEDMSRLTGVRVLAKSTNTWAASSGLELEGCKTGESQVLLRELIAKGAHLDIVDFDDHLNDVTKGWLQPVSKLPASNTSKSSKKPQESYP